MKAMAEGRLFRMPEQRLSTDIFGVMGVRNWITRMSASQGPPEERVIPVDLKMKFPALLSRIMKAATGEAASYRSPGTVSFGGARFCSGGFFFAVLWRRARLERTQKPCRDLRDVLDGSQERTLVGLRRLRKSADFPHKLKRSRSNLFFRDRWIEVEEGSNVPAHGSCNQDSKRSP